MSAQAITEPAGNKAGRVTIATTLASLVPPVVAALVVIVCFMVGILSAEVAAAAILAILATAGFTTGAVFTTGKKTPTDQVRTQTEIVPVAEGTLEEKAEAAAATVPPGAHRADTPEDFEDPESDLKTMTVEEIGRI